MLCSIKYTHIIKYFIKTAFQNCKNVYKNKAESP